MGRGYGTAYQIARLLTGRPRYRRTSAAGALFTLLGMGILGLAGLGSAGKSNHATSSRTSDPSFASANPRPIPAPAAASQKTSIDPTVATGPAQDTLAKVPVVKPEILPDALLTALGLKEKGFVVTTPDKLVLTKSIL